MKNWNIHITYDISVWQKASVRYVNCDCIAASTKVFNVIVDHNVGTIPKYNITIVERGKIDTPNTQIHDCSIIPLTHKCMTAQLYP
jgi:hypothetical protein